MLKEEGLLWGLGRPFGSLVVCQLRYWRAGFRTNYELEVSCDYFLLCDFHLTSTLSMKETVRASAQNLTNLSFSIKQMGLLRRHIASKSCVSD